MNTTKEIGTQILMEENPMVVGWINGSFSFVMMLIVACLIGLGLWLIFGDKTRGGFM